MSYRLGDLILLEIDEKSKNEILIEYPNTIGSEYIIQYYDKKSHFNKGNVLFNILINKMKEFNYPPDIKYSIVVHLRLGDVVCGDDFYEKEKRPNDLSYYKHIKSQFPDIKFYLIANCFFPKNYNSESKSESIKESNKYLSDIIKILDATHINGDADFDLCCAIQSKLFIQGKGMYSRLIVELRNIFNMTSILNNIDN